MPNNNNEIKIRIKHKKDSSSNWNSKNPILLDGELGIESDTGRIKIGDGTTTWDKLKYSNSIRAEQDSEGNLIIDHYATKIELTNAIDKLNTHTHNINNDTTGTLSASRGGTGQTSLRNSANSLLNALETGSSNPQDADYYIAQYAGGGNATTTYHRRPVSALYNYIKNKTDSVYTSKTEFESSLSSVSNSLSNKLDKTGTAAKATADANGNNISTTYATKSEVIYKKETIVDLRSLNESTWYPVTGSRLSTEKPYKILVMDYAGTPSWSRHETKAWTSILELYAIGNGWGWTSGATFVKFQEFGWLVDESIPPIGYTQMTNTSTPVVYLRGGGSYKIETDYDCTWTIQNTTCTISSQSVSPVTTYPGINYSGKLFCQGGSIWIA